MMVPRERACMGYPYPVVMSRFGRHLLLLLFALLASAVAGEELRDVNYRASFSWLAHTICALTAFENHCND